MQAVFSNQHITWSFEKFRHHWNTLTGTKHFKYDNRLFKKNLFCPMGIRQKQFCSVTLYYPSQENIWSWKIEQMACFLSVLITSFDDLIFSKFYIKERQSQFSTLTWKYGLIGALLKCTKIHNLTTL